MPYDFFRQRNRFQNIFDKPKPFEDFGLSKSRLDTPSIPTNEGSDIASRMSQLYTPETEATERFNQLMNEIPERTEPGKLRKIFADFIGMGGPSTEAIAYGPYHRALADWETKLKPAEVGMIQERLRNANERALVGDIARTEVAGRRADTAQRESERKQQEGEQRLEIQRKRAEVYKFKAEHPTWRYIEVPGGNIIGFNPQNPAERVDTGINSGHLTDIDRINLQIKGQEEVARVRGQEARETRRTPTAGQTTKPQSELEKRRGIANKAGQIKNQHPEWSKWIKVEGDNVTITVPGRFTGPDRETYNKIYREIYGVASPEEVKPASSHGTETAKAEEPKKKDPLGIR